mgnify:FL=1
MPKDPPGDGTFGFQDLLHLLDPDRFREALEKHLATAHARVGQEFVTRTVTTITRKKPFDPNAPLTVALKGSSTPLVDRGDLVSRITFEVVSAVRVRLGIASPKLDAGKGRYLYEVLHNGATIPVTPAMRAAVMAKLQEKMGDEAFDRMADFFRNGPSRGFWVIPPRPFLKHTFERPDFWKAALGHYRDAVERAIEDGLPSNLPRSS